jgi:Holliday junction DNA helicase RuvB
MCNIPEYLPEADESNCINGQCTMIEHPASTLAKPLNKTPISNQDIFSGIVGHELLKEEFHKALVSEKTLHIILVGPPGCGKSQFLLAMKKAIPASEFIDGSYGSKAGVVSMLLDKEPRYLLIDEIDKLEERDQIALFNLMESGIVSRTLRSGKVEKKMKVTVFATANTDETLLPPLLSRFFALYLREYPDEDFKELAIKAIAPRENIQPEVALHIAVSVLRKLGSRDLRDVIKIAQRATTIEEVDKEINIAIEYGKHNR